MKFEMFDRDAVPTGPAVVEPPLVLVDATGRLLFNRPAWAFLSMQFGWLANQEVVLLFDVETRTVGVQPVEWPEAGVQPDEPPSARWAVVRVWPADRSIEWPYGIEARPFVEHYRVAPGRWAARLMRGPGPRMVTFEVGEPRSLPAPDARTLRLGGVVLAPAV